MAEDSELWYTFLDLTQVVPKTKRKYDEADRKMIGKSYIQSQKTVGMWNLADEYNRI